ncbi:unnamed protein product [marine sediment metagenome]|uniref:Uncharacterized protein n=1 Tax=marine sediment metagenome TaxID=412755 RepID=X0Y4P5_9ZZZZ
MELNVMQRLMLLPLVPEDGISLVDLRVAEDLHRQLGFTEEEQAQFEFIQTADRLDWNPVGNEPVEIRVGPRAHVIMQDVLRKMAEDKTLKRDQVQLYDLFGCDEDE